MDGMKAGSRVAGARLYRLNEEQWKQTLCTVRQSYRGIGGDSWYLGPHESHWHGPSGLWYFSATGNDREVRRLLSENSQTVNTPFVDGETALLAACRSGHADVVHLLLENGANASLMDGRGITPLHFLSSFDSREIIATVASALVNRNGSLEAWAYHRTSMLYSGGSNGVFSLTPSRPELHHAMPGDIEHSPESRSKSIGCLQEHHSELKLENFGLLDGCATRQRATLRLKGASCICCR